MKDRVELDAIYPHPPERVWKALTDPDALSHWLMPADFQPMIGYRFRLQRPDGASVRGKVTDVEENRLLAYTWQDDDDGPASLVVWTLRPQDGGTRVSVQHRVLEDPTVTCIAIDTYFNWLYALRHSLPGLLSILAHQEGRLPRAPTVYVANVESRLEACGTKGAER